MAQTTGLVQRLKVTPGLVLAWAYIGPSPNNTTLLIVMQRTDEPTDVSGRASMAEALSVAGDVREAEAIRTRMIKSGPSNDPRTYALYLATRGEDTTNALRLAEAELNNRADVFTHDALAWCLAANGRWAEARSQLDRALAEGTQDARLFFHAAQIAAHSGQPGEARRFHGIGREEVVPEHGMAEFDDERRRLGPCGEGAEESRDQYGTA